MRLQVNKMSFKVEKNINIFKYYLHGFIDGIVHIYSYCIYIYNFVHTFLFLFKFHFKYSYHRICVWCHTYGGQRAAVGFCFHHVGPEDKLGSSGLAAPPV